MGRADLENIEAVLAGDRDAFHGIVERHGPPVWSGLTRLLGNREDAREVFQETFTRAFERLGSLREPGRLRSWLLSIALNQARARLRRPLSMRALDPAEEQLGIAGSAPPSSEAAETHERAELVLAAVAALPPRQRQVVELRMNSELSHAEIAAALGISEDASRANYYQGLRQLKARLEPRLEPDR